MSNVRRRKLLKSRLWPVLSKMALMSRNMVDAPSGVAVEN